MRQPLIVAPPDRADQADYSAVKLFLQSARCARRGSELEANDLKYVSRICRLVEVMPLGIELAAAWAEILTPDEIAAEIAQSLDLLVTDLYDVPERQRLTAQRHINTTFFFAEKAEKILEDVEK